MGKEMNDQDIKNAVKEGYTRLARNASSCCGSGCCSSAKPVSISKKIGYTDEQMRSVPEGANLGLGCGNPIALASLKKGETVLDLGSGAGFDCFLASNAVGPQGHVIGVDMTPEMVSKARANALKGQYGNVEFRLGEIEHLPIADAVADVVISNCVINLSPDKPQVFREAFRVLKAGGRLAISDVVATAPLPEDMRNDAALIAGCMGNASLIADLEAMMRAAGFEQIRIQPKDESKTFIEDWAPGRKVTDFVVSATIEAIKPGTTPSHLS